MSSAVKSVRGRLLLSGCTSHGGILPSEGIETKTRLVMTLTTWGRECRTRGMTARKQVMRDLLVSTFWCVTSMFFTSHRWRLKFVRKDEMYCFLRPNFSYLSSFVVIRQHHFILFSSEKDTILLSCLNIFNTMTLSSNLRFAAFILRKASIAW